MNSAEREYLVKIGLKESFELTTRSQFTKVNCEIGMTVDGRELPPMSILGEALEEAIALIQRKIKDSYKVPPRVSTPVVGAPT